MFRTLALPSSIFKNIVRKYLFCSIKEFDLSKKVCLNGKGLGGHRPTILLVAILNIFCVTPTGEKAKRNGVSTNIIIIIAVSAHTG